MIGQSRSEFISSLLGALAAPTLGIVETQVADPFQEVFESTSLQSDLDFLVRVFADVGAAPFAYSSETQFMSAYTDLRASLCSPLSLGRFFLRSAALFATVNDGHVDTIPKEQYATYCSRGGTSFPLSLAVSGSALTVHKVTDPNIPLGSTIVSINDVGASAIIDCAFDLQRPEPALARASKTPLLLTVVFDRDLRSRVKTTPSALSASMGAYSRRKCPRQAQRSVPQLLDSRQY